MLHMSLERLTSPQTALKECMDEEVLAGARATCDAVEERAAVREAEVEALEGEVARGQELLHAMHKE